MISIVTAAYNASAYIGRAIQSVQSQSFKDWELVVVDDGSTDNTSDIVKAYAEEDLRIKLIILDENVGAGLARREAIKHIKGEYTTFIDSDDYYKEDCLETLLGYMKKYDVDIVSQGHISVTEGGDVIRAKIPRKVIQVGPAKFQPNKEDTKRFLNMMLIKSHLWEKVEYSARRYNEDTSTLVQILFWARNIMLIDYAGYFYVQRPDSLGHSAGKFRVLLHKTLCIKDLADFFTSVRWNHLSNDVEFINHYQQVLKTCTLEDKARYHKELEELNSYYKRLKT